MVCLARPTIEFQQIDKRRPPSALPLGMLEMLAASLQVSNTPLVETCWAAFKEVHNKAALSHAFDHICPPVRVCQMPDCLNQRDSDDIMTLTEPLTGPLCCMSNKRSKVCVLHLFGQYLQM
ncbi:hypothetical protein B0H10DRAFT_2077233 [Mycena sp. CBHHK59/15]|nr:hypothetical protein B0H10DRAFT_2077233 [Mycena sp. CBHHK59/15]